jgi:beta-N-acetylhexosaminidase
MFTRSFLTLLIFICMPFISFCADLDKMIGQMVMVGFKGTSTSNSPELIQQIKDGRVGGIIFYGYNVENPQQVANLNQAFKKLVSADSPILFTAVDQEGGKVQRLSRNKGFENMPSAFEVAASYSPDKSYKVFLSLAKMVKDAGFNINFAPSIDLNVNPESPAIGKIHRSFSSDPIRVSLYAEEFVKAHNSQKVVTSLKHFPGHGSATNDSHIGFTDITNTWSEEELEPFKIMINKGLAVSVMTAHMFNSKIDSEYPATLSAKHLKILRKDLGFDGVIFTDDLQMGALRDNYDLETIVIKSVQAGADVLLYSNFFVYDPLFPEKAAEILKKAVKDEVISIKTIENSYERILKLKKTLL